MTETGVTLFLLLLVSAGCWVLVLQKSTRRKFQRAAWRFYRLQQEEQREAYDAMILAGVLVMALVFSILFVGALVAAFLSYK